MAAKTQLQPTATPGKRYSSFAGKPASAGSAGTPITQLAPTATPGRRYGSFTGKPSSVAPLHGGITQLCPTATPGRRYGLFGGKTATAASPSQQIYYSHQIRAFSGVRGKRMRR